MTVSVRYPDTQHSLISMYSPRSRRKITGMIMTHTTTRGYNVFEVTNHMNTLLNALHAWSCVCIFRRDKKPLLGFTH